MAQQVKVNAARPVDLSLVTRTHMIEGGDQLLQVALTSIHAHGTVPHTHVYTLIISDRNLKNSNVCFLRYMSPQLMSLMMSTMISP